MRRRERARSWKARAGSWKERLECSAINLDCCWSCVPVANNMNVSSYLLMEIGIWRGANTCGLVFQCIGKYMMFALLRDWAKGLLRQPPAGGGGRTRRRGRRRQKKCDTGCLRLNRFSWVGKHKYYHETDELPNPRPTQPTRNQVETDIWANFSHSKYFFVG